MKQEPFRTHNYAAQVCIDSYDNRVLCGRLQSAAWDGDENFSSLMDFFCKMEQLLDQMLPTQAFTTRRTFCAVPPTIFPSRAHPAASRRLPCAFCSARTPAGKARSCGAMAVRRSASAVRLSLCC